MKIINLFGLYPKELFAELSSNSKSKMDFAANNLQEAMIKGYEATNADYYIINAPFIGAWPLFYRKIFVKGCCSIERKITSIRYLNVALIKRWDMLKRVRKTLFDYLKKQPVEPIVILFYNFNFVSLAKEVKEKYPHVKTCLLVTDLPEYMASNSRSIVSRLDKLFTRESTSYAKYIDGYVLLAERMKERLPVGDSRYHIMEGIYNPDDQDSNANVGEKKVILYTGNMDPRYGIEDLVNAFSLIDDPNIELWLRGDGVLLNLVQKRAEIDCRIKIIERLSRSELLRLERRSTILVNPVHSSEEFTDFFFPSKTMEYLASGTPTLMCKLGCLPPEYHEHLYFFESEDVEGMASTMRNLCNKDKEELEGFGMKAKNFIINEKNPKVQISKLVSFFECL